jgi:transposase
MDKGQIVKLVGVAPLNRDSDQMRGKRMISGGRKPVRDALHARPAIRFDPGIKAEPTASPERSQSSPSSAK